MRVWPVVLALALPVVLAGCPQFSSDWTTAPVGADGSAPETSSPSPEAGPDVSTDGAGGGPEASPMVDAPAESSTDAVSDVIVPGDSTAPPGCSADSTVSGCIASDGYSCPAGASAPNVTDPTLTCSVPTMLGGAYLYCCFTSPYFPADSCWYNPSLDAACPDPDSFGYSCASGDNPMSYAPSLTCSDDPAATGDFCCTIK